MSGRNSPYGIAAPSTVPMPYSSPPPPPGPGVQAPFVAPPTDGAKRRRGWAIGLSIGAVLLLCLGGAVGIGGLAVLGQRVVSEQAEASVERYLTALRDAKYDAAYDELCDEIQANTSRDEFESTERGRRVVDFEVGDTIAADSIMVPATIHYEKGPTRSVRYRMAQDRRTGALEVCGEA